MMMTNKCTILGLMSFVAVCNHGSCFKDIITPLQVRVISKNGLFHLKSMVKQRNFMKQDYYVQFRFMVHKSIHECIARLSFHNGDPVIMGKICDPVMMKAIFDSFSQYYYKKYDSQKEYIRRYNVFLENVLKSQLYGSTEKGTAEYGVTRWSDMKTSEVNSFLTGLKIPQIRSTSRGPWLKNVSAPESHDWRKYGVVAPPRHQKQCSSCWAISAVSNAESLAAIDTGVLIPLSVQQVVDCNFKGAGCSSSLLTTAYSYMKQKHLTSEESYPYMDGKRICIVKGKKNITKIKTYIQLPEDEDQLKKYVYAIGPVVVTFNSKDLQAYRKGIVYQDKSSCDPLKINHAGLAVGYGIEQNAGKGKIPYWIIKNSWGKKWGENGYFRLYRGQGTCGIGSISVTALLDKSYWRLLSLR